MAAPTYESTTTTNDPANATTREVALPAAVDVGDWLIYIGAIDDSLASPVVDEPNWELIWAEQIADPSWAVWVKVADGTEDGGAITVTSSSNQQGTHQVIRVSNPPDSLRWFMLNGVRRSDRPEISIYHGMNLPALHIWVSQKSTANTFSAPPTGYSNTTISGQDDTSGAALMTAIKSASAADLEETDMPTSSGNSFSQSFILTIFDPLVPALPTEYFDYLSVVSVTPTDFDSDVTSHPADVPAVVPGDKLIAIPSFDATAAVITTPSGWTRLAGGLSNSIVSGVYFREVSAIEAETTVDFETDEAQRGTVQVWQFRGVGRILCAGMVDSDDSSTSEGPMRMRTGELNDPECMMFFVRCVSSSQSVDLNIYGLLTIDENNKYYRREVSGQDDSTGGDVEAIIYPSPTSLEVLANGYSDDTTLRSIYTLVLFPDEANATISGTVTLNGSPVEGAVVCAYDSNTNRYFGPTETDVNGDYSIRCISGITYHVSVEYDDGDKYQADSYFDIVPVSD